MFETGNKNFWKAQMLGWGLMAGSNLLVQSLAGFSNLLLFVNTIFPFLVGFALTTIYRTWIKRFEWNKWSLKAIIGLVVFSTIGLTGLMILILQLLLYLFSQIDQLDLPRMLSNFIIFGFIMLCWNMIYFFIHYFNHWHQAEIDKWKITAEMKEAQLGSLRSQINPHFIFNAINNIRSLILEDKEKAREMLLNFSDLFRYALQHTDNQKVELSQEIEIVEQYLALLSIQFEEKLQFELSVDKGLEDVLIPPMMLQLLVENSVKHGISQFTDGGRLWVKVNRSEEFLKIEVKNSGQLKQGKSLGHQLGVGLENIKKRLQLLYQDKAKFELTEQEGFVVASIKIPML